MPNLKYITMTGADDLTKIEDMVALSQKYPLLEWAILFSQSKSGVPRYPSLDWVERLKEHADKLNLSAHLCGKWVRDVLELGRITFFDDPAMFKMFNRVQMNCAKNTLSNSYRSMTFWAAMMTNQKIKILGGNYAGVNRDEGMFNHKAGHVCPLYDASGGRGETGSYLKPFEFDALDETLGLATGYAGGLGPENIAEEFDKILEAAGERAFWIDMESRVRTIKDGKDYLDLEKVETVLEIVTKRLHALSSTN